MPSPSQDPEALETRYEARLRQEVARLREQSHHAVEEFKRGFPPPSEEQIERLLYPELSAFSVDVGGRRFLLRELPALVEKKFLGLVEQKLPLLVRDILSFDERLGDDPGAAFTQLLARASSAVDLLSDACVLMLDPLGEAGLTRDFLQQHASTSRQLRILQAQLLLNGARDFLSRLFPGLTDDTPAATPPLTGPTPPLPVIPGSPPPSAGSSSSTNPRA